jgi:transcriptional regulator with XRE-family HTH domain
MIVLTKEEQNVADILRKEAQAQNLSIRDLAGKSGVPRSTVEQALNGKASPRVGIVAQLARALGLQLELRRPKSR